MRVLLILWMAWRDWAGEWRTSLCLVIGVAAAVAPLLMLLAVRSGVIEGLRGELERDPSSRELRTVGQPRIAWALVEALARRPDVAFVRPTTRLLSAAGVLRPVRRGGDGEPVDLAPSGPGDPLASPALIGAHGAAPGGRGGAVISDLTARALRLHPGDDADLIVERTRVDGVRQSLSAPLRIVGVLPAWLGVGGRMLIAADLLTACEIYREDPAVQDLAGALTEARHTRSARVYAGLRLYARDIDAVEDVRAALQARGVETEGRLDEIRLVRRLDVALTTLFVALAAVVGVGLCVSLAAAQWAWVDRKRRDLGYLRLIGLEPGELSLMPMAQSALTAGTGAVLAGLVAWLGQGLINDLFAGRLSGVAQVSRLHPGQVASATGLSLLVALIAALAAALSTRRIVPAAVLREG